jgi:hypothetical protein
MLKWRSNGAGIFGAKAGRKGIIPVSSTRLDSAQGAVFSADLLGHWYGATPNLVFGQSDVFGTTSRFDSWANSGNVSLYFVVFYPLYSY